MESPLTRVWHGLAATTVAVVLAACDVMPKNEPVADEINIYSPSCTTFIVSEPPTTGAPLATADAVAVAVDDVDLPGVRFRSPYYDTHTHSIPPDLGYSVEFFERHVVGLGSDADIPYVRVRDGHSSWSTRAEHVTLSPDAVLLVDRNLYAVDPADGSLKWCLAGGDDAAVVGPVVYATAGDAVGALATATGRVSWAVTWSSENQFVLADDQHVVVGAGYASGSLTFLLIGTDGTDPRPFTAAIPGTLSEATLQDGALFVQVDDSQWMRIGLGDE